MFLLQILYLQYCMRWYDLLVVVWLHYCWLLIEDKLTRCIYNRQCCKSKGFGGKKKARKKKLKRYPLQKNRLTKGWNSPVQPVHIFSLVCSVDCSSHYYAPALHITHFFFVFSKFFWSKRHNSLPCYFLCLASLVITYTAWSILFIFCAPCCIQCTCIMTIA
jgi:hypothetical protein